MPSFSLECLKHVHKIAWKDRVPLDLEEVGDQKSLGTKIGLISLDDFSSLMIDLVL